MIIDRLKLLPYKTKKPGYVLVIIGVILSVFYFTLNWRLTLPVFAVFSSFIENKFFVTFRTNFADELILLTFLTGFLFVILSKDRYEKESDYELINKLRLKAFLTAFIINQIVMILCVLFLYGRGFIAAAILNMFSFSVIYLVAFTRLKWKNKTFGD